MTAALAPSALRRNGVSTSMTPNDSPARHVSHIPAERRRSRKARKALSRLWDSPPEGVPTRKLATARQNPAKVAAPNAGAVPMPTAKAPMTGPTRIPAPVLERPRVFT